MAFGKRTAPPEAPVAVEECDILTLTRLNLHPLISPLYERREGLQEKKANLLVGQKQLDNVRVDFERLHSLALAEEEPETMRQWRELKQQLQDYEDQLQLVEAGVYELDGLIDTTMAEVREVVQGQIDSRLVEPIRAMIAGLQALLPTNQELHTLENCQHRFFSTVWRP